MKRFETLISRIVMPPEGEHIVFDLSVFVCHKTLTFFKATLGAWHSFKCSACKFSLQWLLFLAFLHWRRVGSGDNQRQNFLFHCEWNENCLLKRHILKLWKVPIHSKAYRFKWYWTNPFKCVCQKKKKMQQENWYN